MHVFLNSLCLLRGLARNGGYVSTSNGRHISVQKMRQDRSKADNTQRRPSETIFQCPYRSVPHGVMYFLKQNF